MAKFSLRKFETQARASVVAGIAAIVCLLGQAFVVLHNIEFSSWVIYYGNRSRPLIVMVATAVTALLAMTAMGFGFNSAGQRRNDKPQWSWSGFFMGAAVLCFAIILPFIFRERSEFIR